ncbi:MAG: hypothetical protein ACPG61_16680 [Paracoccaceae bacterium]
MTQYALIAALLGVLGLSGALWWQVGTLDTLRDDNARLTRNAGVLQGQIEQARLAADVAAAYAERERQIASAAASTIDTIRNLDLGECADAPIDPDLADALGRL